MQKTAEWEISFYEQQTKPLASAKVNATAETHLDATALEAFIKKQMPHSKKIAVGNIERVMGGYGKETWFFDLATDNGKEQLVVRRSSATPGQIDKGSFYIPQEFPLINILYKEGILLPEPLWMGMDELGADSPFYIVKRVPGKPMGTFLKGNEDLTEGLWLQVAERLAQIHGIPIQKFSGYINKFYGSAMQNCTAGEGMLHYLNWWHDYWKSFDRIASPLEIYLFDWLYSNLPKNSRPASLIHSGFGPHNMLADNGKLTAILDWESALFGSPAMDLSYIKPWVTETMDWQKFVDRYVACGGTEVDESEYGFCNALTYTRTLTATSMLTANLRFHPSAEYKELMLALQFVPKMMKTAWDSTMKTTG